MEQMDSICECCEKDELGNWLRDPCCYDGYCESDATTVGESIGNCIHCGGEMFKENDIWWHHTQKEIPMNKRGMMHWGI